MKQNHQIADAHAAKSIAHLEDLELKEFQKKRGSGASIHQSKSSRMHSVQQSQHSIKDSIENALSLAKHTEFSHAPNEQRTTKHRKVYTSFALVIEGEAISHAINESEALEEFIQVISECRTVICCRSSPNQKAEIVKTIKRCLGKVTLSIGDGGNDVNMIQEANIGVGIMGKEGNQAAMSSD